MNIFMQFIYCFLFLIYLAFLPASGWAISLIWAMMILPLADTLQNCLQNLTSRIAGVDNEQMTNRVLGTSAMLGFGLGAIKEQFKTPNTVNGQANNNLVNNTNSGLKGIVSRTKEFINPNTTLSEERDYNGNVNPIRNVITKKENQQENETISKSKINNTNDRKIMQKSIVKNVLSSGVKGTKAYLNIGAKMAEGNFSPYKYKKQDNLNNNKKVMQNTEYLNNTNNLQKGAENELKEKNEK